MLKKSRVTRIFCLFGLCNELRRGQRSKSQEEISPSYWQVLQEKITEQEHEYRINRTDLLRDYLIAKRMLGATCPECRRRLAKDVEKAVQHLYRLHFNYYQLLVERMILKEIKYVKKHCAERQMSEYYDTLPIYFESPKSMGRNYATQLYCDRPKTLSFSTLIGNHRLKV